jgi:cell division protein FtsW (lipid II flippase)
MRNDDRISSYLQSVLGQIRWKKARPTVEEELDGHIEEHIQSAMEKGLSEESAVSEAVLAMGDPLETGRRLDRLHRPRVDILLALSASLLIAFSLALIFFYYFQFRFELSDIKLFLPFAFAFCLGIACASADIRRIVEKAALPMVIGGLVGLLAFCIASLFFDVFNLLLNFHDSKEMTSLFTLTEWLSLAHIVCIVVFILGFGGWLSRIGKGDKRSVVLAVLAVFAASAMLVLTETVANRSNMYCTAFTCMSMLLCSKADKKRKIAAGSVIAAGVIIYMCLFYATTAAKNAEYAKTNGLTASAPLFQTAMQNLQDLKLVGAAKIATTKEITGLFGEPLGYMLLHYGILPALLLFASVGVLIWRMLRSALRIRDSIGRTLATGVAVYLAVRIIAIFLLNIVQGRVEILIPFMPVTEVEIGLPACLLGLNFGLYRRKELYPAMMDDIKSSPAGEMQHA